MHQFRRKTRSLLWVLIGLVVAIAVLEQALFFTLTVDDAYISLRYARNIAGGVGPVFNIGEPVNAMTSPLHVFAIVPFFWPSEDPMIFNKILGVVAAFMAAILVGRTFRSAPWIATFVFAAALLPTPLLFWSSAGLETAFLALACAVAVVLARQAGTCNRAYLLLCIVAGIAFLLRYDSAVFFTPLLLALGLTRLGGRIVLAWGIGAIAPACWLLFSWLFFGDLFPTSFYTKTPGLADLNGNLIYITLYLLVTGLGPIAFFLLFVPVGLKAKRLDLVERAVLLGLLCVLVYGLTAARAHMMFQMRFFAPYVPVLAFLCGARMQHYGLLRKLPFGATGVIAFASVISAIQIQFASVNGFARQSEYSKLDAQSYKTFMARLETNAQDIEAHWETVGSDRPLRFFTYTEGVVPYRLTDSYVFGGLVSFRHTAQFVPTSALVQKSDYVHIMAPRHGSIEAQTQDIPDAVLISDVPVFFDGNEERSQVFWNPNPDERPISSRVNGP